MNEEASWILHSDLETSDCSDSDSMEMMDESMASFSSDRNLVLLRQRQVPAFKRNDSVYSSEL